MTNIHQLASFWVSESLHGLAFIAALLIGGTFMVAGLAVMVLGMIVGVGMLLGAW